MFPKIATVGDNCMDVYDNTGKAYPGGNPVNVAVYFARMGGEASYTGIVGDDAYGKLMLEAIAAKGVDVSHVRTEKGATAVTHVQLLDGERVMGDYEEGVLADFTLTPEEVEYLGHHKLVVSALWGNCQQYFKDFRKFGAKIAYDAATSPDAPAAMEAIPFVDYFFFSSDDGDTEALRTKMKTLHAMGPSLVIAMLGDKGSLVYNGSDYISHGITPCKVVDTMGAGDSYIAGFLLELINGSSVKECMQRGADNAAETIGYFGAW